MLKFLKTYVNKNTILVEGGFPYQQLEVKRFSFVSGVLTVKRLQSWSSLFLLYSPRVLLSYQYTQRHNRPPTLEIITCIFPKPRNFQNPPPLQKKREKSRSLIDLGEPLLYDSFWERRSYDKNILLAQLLKKNTKS